MVDVHGNIWITDFGLAHFHDTAGLTHTGDLVGTLRYMSPEQASGQRVVLDHRTDIYSLGATFYELLTLQPIFAGRTRQTLLADVLNHDPRPPRAIDRRIPVELEIIILKALSRIRRTVMPRPRPWPTTCAVSSATSRSGPGGRRRWSISASGCGGTRRCWPRGPS